MKTKYIFEKIGSMTTFMMLKTVILWALNYSFYKSKTV